MCCCSPYAFHKREGTGVEQATVQPTSNQKRRRDRPSCGLQRSAKAERCNDLQSWRKLWRMVDCNFSSNEKDLCVALEFSNASDWAEAQRQAYAFIRCVKRLRRKRGLADLRWLLLRGDYAGKRVAFLFINKGVSVRDLAELWQAGKLTGSILRDTANRTELEAYLDELHANGADSGGGWAMGERKRHGRRWTASRNLQIPWA